MAYLYPETLPHLKAAAAQNNAPNVAHITGLAAQMAQKKAPVSS